MIVDHISHLTLIYRDKSDILLKNGENPKKDKSDILIITKQLDKIRAKSRTRGRTSLKSGKISVLFHDKLKTNKT